MQWNICVFIIFLNIIIDFLLLDQHIDKAWKLTMVMVVNRLALKMQEEKDRWQGEKYKWRRDVNEREKYSKIYIQCWEMLFAVEQEITRWLKYLKSQR